MNAEEESTASWKGMAAGLRDLFCPEVLSIS